MNRGDDRPSVSLVIRAYNEARHLPALFGALEDQANSNFEVILVDSGSMDGSREIAANRGARVIKIESHDFTFGYSLNVGIEAARGAVIAIASAHTIPCGSDWLERLTGHFEDDDVAMVYGRQLGVSSSKFSECEDFRRTYGARSISHRGSKFFANNANSAVRRELWSQRPFDEALPGLEDMDWAKYWAERDYRIVYEPEAALLHVHEETWPQVRHRYYREAVAAKAKRLHRSGEGGLSDRGRSAAQFCPDW
jgi:glycosyltransferase involved in cell wall biosynthesis